MDIYSTSERTKQNSYRYNSINYSKDICILRTAEQRVLQLKLASKTTASFFRKNQRNLSRTRSLPSKRHSNDFAIWLAIEIQ